MRKIDYSRFIGADHDKALDIMGELGMSNAEQIAFDDWFLDNVDGDIGFTEQDLKNWLLVLNNHSEQSAPPKKKVSKKWIVLAVVLGVAVLFIIGYLSG